MTPDLSTPEGRAELRAYYPPGGTLKIDAHMNAALDALDAAYAAQATMPGEIAGLTSDIADALDSITKAEGHIDVLEATIERLTAPVTEGEGGRTADLYMNGRKPMCDVLDAFIARRKEPAP